MDEVLALWEQWVRGTNSIQNMVKKLCPACVTTWPSPLSQHHWFSTLSVPHLPTIWTKPFPLYRQRGPDELHKKFLQLMDHWPSCFSCSCLQFSWLTETSICLYHYVVQQQQVSFPCPSYPAFSNTYITFLCTLRHVISMYITLCRHNPNRRATTISSKDYEYSWHTFCIIYSYLRSYCVKHTGRWQQCVCYYTNMSMDKQAPYTTVQRGGQNNYLQISETMIMQTYNLGRPAAHYKSGQFSIVWQFTI